MKENIFCALNITNSDEELINKNNRPLMYIWDGTRDLFEQMSLDKDFINFIKQELDLSYNIKNYCNAKISGFIYKKSNTSEPLYENKDISIQEMFSLSDLDDIALKYLSFIINKLYNMTFNTYISNDNYENIEERIKWQYNEIKNKYKGKVSELTIIQAIRSIIQTDKEFYGMKRDNQDYILNRINKILE